MLNSFVVGSERSALKKIEVVMLWKKSSRFMLSSFLSAITLPFRFMNLSG